MSIFRRRVLKQYPDRYRFILDEGVTIMRTVCNRYNSQKLIDTLQPWGSKMTLNARWQVSVKDENGRCYDHFFVTKPTRKQIRKLHKV